MLSPRSESEHAQICNQLQLESEEDQRIMTLDTSSICYTCHGVSQLLRKDNLIIFLHFHILYLNEWHLHLTSSKLEMSTSLTTFYSSFFVVNHLQNVVDLASSFESTISFLFPTVINFRNLVWTLKKHTHTPKNVFLPLVSSFAKQTLVISVTPAYSLVKTFYKVCYESPSLSSKTPNFLLRRGNLFQHFGWTLLLFTSFL